MKYHVNIADVSDETLAFVGYVLVYEDGDTKVYLNFGTEIVVDKSDPFILVEDANDLPILGKDYIRVPDPPED